MNVLGMETSGTTSSVALCRDEVLLRELTLPVEQRSAKSLAPTIRTAFVSVGWQPKDVQLVAVTTGPGSFTGLRVGVVTAKAFAYAIGCGVVGVDTLEVIATQTLSTRNRDVIALVDAQRGEVFAARWRLEDDGRRVCVEPSRIVTFDELISGQGDQTTFTGPALEKFQDRLPAGIAITSRDAWSPMARTVAQIGLSLWASGNRDDAFALAPQYFRRTAAEEQWDKSHGSAGP